MIFAPNSTTSDAGVPLGVGLASQPHLPEAARNAIWQAGLLDGWVAGQPVPGPPGVLYAGLLAGGLTAAAAAALAAGHTDPDALDGLVRSRDDAQVWEAATGNPNLSTGTARLLQRRFPALADRVAADDTLAAHLTSGSGSAADVADRLWSTHAAVLIADVLTSTDPAAQAVADDLHDRLANVGWGNAAVTDRRVRAAVVNLVVGTPALARLGAAVATNRRGCIDPGILPAVREALDVGVLADADIAAASDTDAAAVAELWGGNLARFVLRPQAPAVVRRKRHGDVLDDDPHSACLDGEFLALLGLETVGARVKLSSPEPLTDDDVASALADADPETILDWAEGLLPNRPAPGQLVRQIDALDARVAHEVGREAERRPDVLDNNPELALALPGMTRQPMPAAAVRIVRLHLEQTLGADEGAWLVAATLIADGADLNVIDIAETARLTATTSA